MIRVIFENISEEDKNKAIENIVEHATPRQDFFAMITLLWLSFHYFNSLWRRRLQRMQWRKEIR